MGFMGAIIWWLVSAIWLFFAITAEPTWLKVICCLLVPYSTSNCILLVAKMRELQEYENGVKDCLERIDERRDNT